MDDKVHYFFGWTSEDKSDTDEDDSFLLDSGGVLFTRFGNSVLFLVKNDIRGDFQKFSLPSVFFL